MNIALVILMALIVVVLLALVVSMARKVRYWQIEMRRIEASVQSKAAELRNRQAAAAGTRATEDPGLARRRAEEAMEGLRRAGWAGSEQESAPAPGDGVAPDEPATAAGPRAAQSHDGANDADPRSGARGRAANEPGT